MSMLGGILTQCFIAKITTVKLSINMPYLEETARSTAFLRCLQNFVTYNLIVGLVLSWTRDGR